MYQHIFFDLDHTLWDFETNSKNTMRQLYDRYELKMRGVNDFEAFYTVFKSHNNKLWSRFRKGYIKRDEMRWKRMWHTLLDFNIPHTKIANELSIAYLEILPTQKAVMPFAKEAVAHCASKYKLHIITNGFEFTQRQKLHHCGLSAFFDQIITSEKSNSIKPQKEIFEFAQQITNAEKKHCLMIGDALEIDIAGAMNAEWDTIFFNPENLEHQRKPTFEINSLERLLQIL